MGNLGKVIGVAFMGQTYKKMFSKIDQKFGSKAMPHKRKYTEAMRVFEKRHLIPSQVGVFSNKMQATLDQSSKNKKTSPSTSKDLSKAKRKANYKTSRASGAGLLQRPKAKMQRGGSKLRLRLGRRKR